MRNTILIITIIYIALIANTDLFAQDAQNVEQVRRIYIFWNNAYDVVVQDDYVYVAVWLSGLRIVDIFYPENPEEVGYWDDNPGSARGVTVSGGYAFEGENQICIKFDSIE